MRNEIMELQQKEGYSPLSGCLPLLLQFPIIIFLYNVIRNPLTYICRISDASVVKLGKICGIADPMNNQITLASAINAKGGATAAEFAGKEFAGLADLPDFTLFGLNLGETPSSFSTWLLVLIPFIAAALTWLSMVLSRKWNGNTNPMAQQQDAQSALSFKIMDLLMPGMTLAFAFGFSGMMGIYWIYQSALGILQTFILSKAMPLPKYTEAELKAMRKAQKEAEKAQRAALKAAPKFRSLHYIDEDDYDELPQVKSEGAKKKDSQGSIDAPEIKD
jgi:YidC/Oxa1 family membrane protein insertase